MIGCSIGQQQDTFEYFEQLLNIDEVDQFSDLFTTSILRDDSNKNKNAGIKIEQGKVIILRTTGAKINVFQDLWDDYFRVEKVPKTSKTDNTFDRITSLSKTSKYLFISINRTSYSLNYQAIKLQTAIKNIWSKKTIKIDNYEKQIINGIEKIVKTCISKVTYQLIGFIQHIGNLLV